MKYKTSSVKVMRSYDYCHFEVCLGADDMTLEEVDEMRKNAQRLADKAVGQYKIAKVAALQTDRIEHLRHDVKIIKENYPKSEWTPEQEAKVKALEDWEYYDYQDDWDV